MSGLSEKTVSLSFPLKVEDDWPPVGVESLPFLVRRDGYAALVAPLYVKGLSVGDVIDAKLEAGSNRVLSWSHIAKSGHSTVWLARMRETATLAAVLAELKELGCKVVDFGRMGAYSVDVPESLSIEAVDLALAHLDSDAVAVAFPSMRHVVSEGA